MEYLWRLSASNKIFKNSQNWIFFWYTSFDNFLISNES